MLLVAGVGDDARVALPRAGDEVAEVLLPAADGEDALGGEAVLAGQLGVMIVVRAAAVVCRLFGDAGGVGQTGGLAVRTEGGDDVCRRGEPARADLLLQIRGAEALSEIDLGRPG